MKKLVVCGDSFASASVHTPGKHYSELLASRMGYELVSLARGGMSNPGICLQIEYAIKMQADFVVVSFTDSSRVEIPADPQGFNFVNDDDMYTVDHVQFGKNIRRGYDASRGLENVVYDHKNYLSCRNEFLNKNPTMRSDNVGSLMWGEYYPVSKKQKVAMQYYLTELFDSEWKAQIDHWCIKYCLRELIDSGIPFVMANGGSVWIDEPWMPPSNQLNIDWGKYTSIVGTPGWTDPGYHTNEESQAEIADIFYSKIGELIDKG
jgi:hypothetical protein